MAGAMMKTGTDRVRLLNSARPVRKSGCFDCRSTQSLMAVPKNWAHNLYAAASRAALRAVIQQWFEDE
jgi:hypothetical protein